MVGETDFNGLLTTSAKYDVYGAKRTGGTGTASSRQGFVGSLGHMTDAETGLVYMRARYYDPNIGRFESEDPGRSGGNWFTYCSNNPINQVDPSGKAGNDISNGVIENIIANFITSSFSKFFAFIIDTAPAVQCALAEWLMNMGSSMMGAGETLFDEGAQSITAGTIMDASNQFGDLEVAGQMAQGALQATSGVAAFATGLMLQSVGQFLYYTIGNKLYSNDFVKYDL